uniref:RRM domain-containing protein n=1 Tax=Aegilops tauschii subsp. strangulata TaxID=200361 RepID=A0A453IFI0_AEGTS
LFVTGLSSRLTDRDLEKHFSTEGEVIDASIVLDPWTRESRGFGFVTMATLKEAERCIKYLDRSVLEGRVITVEKQVDARSCLASNSKDTQPKDRNNATSTKGQSEDEVEPQHQEGIWAPNHRVEGGIPEAGHLFGETVTAHATRLTENALILLIAEDDHTLVVTCVDHTPHMKEGNPTLPMAEGDHTLLPTGRSLPATGEGPTHPTTGACLARPAMVIATVQDLHTATEGGGRAPMTVLFQHTTAGAILQGAEDGATLAAYRHAGATPAAALRRRKN